MDVPACFAQARHALHVGRFTTGRDLIQTALGETLTAAERLAGLEMLAQAHTGLQAHAAAASVWQEAYYTASALADKKRLFAAARQTLQAQEDYAALYTLAQAHAAQSDTSAERGSALLAAGEASLRLQQYAEARQHSLVPALALPDLPPETRLHLWHALGVCHLAEHAFVAAAEAFRHVADLALGQHIAQAANRQATAQNPWHQLRATARFYDGMVHLIYHRPQQAIPIFHDLQRQPLATGTLPAAWFLALAHSALQQPEAATRALLASGRGGTAPEAWRGPAAAVRAEVAAGADDAAALGEALATAFGTSLQAHAAWEPTWETLGYQALGTFLQRLGYGDAALACYAAGVHAALQRVGSVEAGQAHDAWGEGQVLTAVAHSPLDTWSAVVRGEVGRLCTRLAWLYQQRRDLSAADAALALALRLALTPEQVGWAWVQRAWLHWTALPAASPGEQAAALLPLAEVLEGLLQAQEACAATPLAQTLRGMAALLQDDVEAAGGDCAAVPVLPEAPECLALCVAAWVYTQLHQGTLPQALARLPQATTPPWYTRATLTMVFEALLTCPSRLPATALTLSWLEAFTAHCPADAFAVLRHLCQAASLPPASRATLVEALRQLGQQSTPPETADQIAVCLGGDALVARIEVLLAALHAGTAVVPPPAPPPAQRRKPSPRPTPTRAARPAPAVTSLTFLLAQLSEADMSTQAGTLPETIGRWLRHYASLSTQAPDIVAALLGLLRHTAGAHHVIPTVLEQVPLSRRQRQALEAVLQAPPTSSVLQGAEGGQAQDHTLGALCAALQTRRSLGADAMLRAQSDYRLALVLQRVGLSASADAALQACLRVAPLHPWANDLLAQRLATQHEYARALPHAMQAWEGLHSLAAPAQREHLEMLSRLLRLLMSTQQYPRLQAWCDVFQSTRAQLRPAPHTDAEAVRLGACEAEWALAQALAYPWPPETQDRTDSTMTQQRALLAQALATGTPTTQQEALYRQAELAAHLSLADEALQGYTTLAKRWPDDTRARLRVALLRAMHPAHQVSTPPAQLCAEALALLWQETGAAEEAPTPAAALAWCQGAQSRGPLFADVVNVLTLYGSAAIHREDASLAIALLTPLYAMTGQRRQAYALALAHDRRSRAADAVGSAQLHDCEQALQYVQAALPGAPDSSEAAAFLLQVQEQYATLKTVREHAQAHEAYRQLVCGLFTRYGVAYQEDVQPSGTGTSWVSLHEGVDLDEASGQPVARILVAFHPQATSEEPTPSEAEVSLYAQHQRDKQRLIEAHGMEAFPWPHVAYAGETPFALLFPERLALNRDLLFLAFADLHALTRYIHMLPSVYRAWQAPSPASAPPEAVVCATAARYATLEPLVRQRVQMLTATTSTKVVQRQVHGVQEALDALPRLEWLREYAAFVDVATYFQAIVDTLRVHLDAPPTAHTKVQGEEAPPPRAGRRQRRPGRERSREGERWRAATPEAWDEEAPAV